MVKNRKLNEDYCDKYSRVDVKLPVELFRELDERRKAEGYATMSELIRTLVRRYLHGPER